MTTNYYTSSSLYKVISYTPPHYNSRLVKCKIKIKCIKIIYDYKIMNMWDLTLTKTAALRTTKNRQSIQKMAVIFKRFHYDNRFNNGGVY